MLADVLLITAARDEDRAVLAVTNGLAEPWEPCEQKPRGYNFDLWRCSVSRGGNKRPFRIILAHAPAQREHATSAVASVLISYFHPFCVGMSGVCAGCPGEVNLGDVIIADKVWKYDAGAIIRRPGAAEAEHWPEIETYQLPMHWKAKAETFRCEIPDYDEAAWGTRPESNDGKPWRVRIGGIATGKDLVRDTTIWNRLVKTQNRKIFGIDMEGSAIGWICEFFDVRRKIIVKGAMDHADPSKTDECRLFAARAAAEVLIQFLRANLDEDKHEPWASNGVPPHNDQMHSCPGMLEVVEVGTDSAVDEKGNSVSSELDLVEYPRRIHFPVLDFKFRNTRHDVVFLKRLRFNVKHAVVDKTPILQFYIHAGLADSDRRERSDGGDLVISIENAGWGTARNVALTNLNSPELRDRLDMGESRYRWTGNIAPGESIKITYPRSHIRKGAEQAFREPSGFVTYEDENGLRYADYVRYTPYHYEEYTVVISEGGFSVHYRDFASAREPSQQYTVLLPVSGSPYVKELAVSHDIRPNDVDRFQVVIASDKSARLEVVPELYFNANERLLCKPVTVRVFYPNPRWYFFYDGYKMKADVRNMTSLRGDKKMGDALDESQFGPMYRPSSIEFRWPCAEAELQAASSTDLNNMAWALIEEGVNIPEGIRLAELAFKKEPDAGTLDTLARGHLKNDRPDLAVKCLEEALCREPDDRELQANLEEARRRLRDRAGQ